MRNRFVVLLTLSALAACAQKESAPAKAANQPPAEMVLVPAGDFIMGSDDIDTTGKSEEFGFNEPWYLPEHPRHTVNLKSYYIDTYEVSNGKYKSYLMGTERVHKSDLVKLLQPMQLMVNDHPVRHVSWYDADDFCKSVGKRLPTEAEWEKAARGANGNEFPWGNEWHADYLNNGGRESQVTPVGSFPQGRSPYGAYDMAGNVMEWTADWYKAYPGSDYQSPKYGEQSKVVRGGGWGGVGHYVIPHYFRGAYRFNFPPDQRYNDIGFRCAQDAP